MSRWPIGAHWCQHAYTEAQDLGLTYTWLAADGLTDDPRSVALHDANGMLASELRYVLTFALSSEERLRNTRPSPVTKVAALYQAAADKGLRLMPIVGVFAEDGHAPVGLAEMAACYLPLLERHRAHILAVGVFCAHHPGSYDPRNHGKGRGVLELGEPYIGGVRWLTGYLHRW